MEQNTQNEKAKWNPTTENGAKMDEFVKKNDKFLTKEEEVEKKVELTQMKRTEVVMFEDFTVKGGRKQWEGRRDTSEK